MSFHNLTEPTLARTRLGSGPGLLLAHGAGSSLAGSFGPILEGLAARHTVVGIDYPGSGESPRSDRALSVDDLADERLAAADAEGPTVSARPATPSAARSPFARPPATPSESPPWS